MLQPLLTHLTKIKQRQLIRLSGDRKRLTQWLTTEINHTDNKSVIWFGRQENEQSHDTATSYFDARLKQYQRYLGQESDIVIFDCYAGLNPDALAALTGTIKQGGICILLTPEDGNWLNYPDPDLQRICSEPYQIADARNFYLKRFMNVLNHRPSVLHFNESNLVYTNIKPEHSVRHTPAITLNHASQQDAVQEIASLFNSSSPKTSEIINKTTQKQALIIQADRGRGKSAALGIATAHILTTARTSKNNARILICALTSDSIQTVMRHVIQTLTADDVCFEQLQNRITLHHPPFISSKTDSNIVDLDIIDSDITQTIEFIAPDLLSLTLPTADMVIIDEAAAIPIQLLTPVIKHYKRQVYSTTVQGYEGTGRGFEYKFKPLLKKEVANVNNLTLTQPMRWQANDWLEADITQLLALDFSLPAIHSPASHSLTPENATTLQPFKPKTTFNVFASDRIEADIAAYEAAFSLLANAHYRTSPNDLRYMLDAPNVELVTLHAENTVIAAGLIAKEGELNTKLCEQIWQGRRRPRGNLFPQSLIAHSGFKQAGQFKYGRIVRIAVHPEYQHNGLGSQLLRNIEQYLTEKNYDFVCTSFGYCLELYKFWHKNQFQPVRLGVKPEASTAEYSILMCRALTKNHKPTTQRLYDALTIRFQQTLNAEAHLKLPSATKFITESYTGSDLYSVTKRAPSIQLNQHDISDLNAFAFHHRSLLSCVLAMLKYQYNYSEKLIQLSPEIFNLVNDVLTPNYSQAKIIVKYNFTGEKQFITKLRYAWREILAE